MTPRLCARLAALVFFVMLLLGSVASAQGPVYATEFRPPAEYRQWYAEVERCARMRGDYTQVLWTVTARPWYQKVNSDAPGKDSSATFGLWHALADGRALIVLTAVDWANEFYVKHEILHDILGRNGYEIPSGLPDVPDSVNVRRAHPAPPFEKCAPTYIDQMRERQRQKDNPWRRVYRP